MRLQPHRRMFNKVKHINKMTNLAKKQQVRELILNNRFEDMDLVNEEYFFIGLFFDEDNAFWCIKRNTNGFLVVEADDEYQFKLDNELADLVEEFISEETKDQRDEPDHHWFMKNHFRNNFKYA